MATNWSIEREEDEEEEEAAQREDIVDEQAEDVEQDKEDERDKVRVQLFTAHRMTRRKKPGDAVCIMYYTHPVVIKLLRGLVFFLDEVETL